MKPDDEVIVTNRNYPSQQYTGTLVYIGRAGNEIIDVVVRHDCGYGHYELDYFEIEHAYT